MNKRKIVTQVVIVILVCLLVVLSIFVIYSKFIKQTDDKKKIYEKYPDISWAETSIYGVRIVDGKLECDDEYKEVCDLSSSINEPIIKVVDFGNYGEGMSLLTESGKVYMKYYDYDISSYNLKQILENYKIVDMSKEERDYSFAYHYHVDWDDGWHNSTGHGIFYLTDDGKLVNQLGNTYEDVNRNFVHSSCFENYYSSYDYEICLFFSKDSSVSYREETKLVSTAKEHYSYPSNVDYTEFKNNLGGKLIAKQVYDVIPPNYDVRISRQKILIVDESNELYEVQYGNNEHKAKLQVYFKM